MKLSCQVACFLQDMCFFVFSADLLEKLRILDRLPADSGTTLVFAKNAQQAGKWPAMESRGQTSCASTIKTPDTAMSI